MLNLFNRVVTIIGLLVLIALAALIIVLAFAPDPVRDQLAASVVILFDLMGAMRSTEQAITAGVAAVVILISFILLVVELRPADNDDLLQVPGTNGGETSITRQSVVRRLEHSISQLDDVLATEPAVTGRAEGLKVHLDVTTSPYIDIPMKTEEIRAVTKEVIEKQMGLGLKKVTVRIDHDTHRNEVAESVQ